MFQQGRLCYRRHDACSGFQEMKPARLGGRFIEPGLFPCHADPAFVDSSPIEGSHPAREIILQTRTRKPHSQHLALDRHHRQVEAQLFPRSIHPGAGGKNNRVTGNAAVRDTHTNNPVIRRFQTDHFVVQQRGARILQRPRQVRD